MGTVEEDCRKCEVEADGLRGVEFEVVGFVRSLVDPAGTNNGVRCDSSLRDLHPFCHACDAEGTNNPRCGGIVLKRAAPSGLLGLIGTSRLLDECWCRKKSLGPTVRPVLSVRMLLPSFVRPHLGGLCT